MLSAKKISLQQKIVITYSHLFSCSFTSIFTAGYVRLSRYLDFNIIELFNLIVLPNFLLHKWRCSLVVIYYIVLRTKLVNTLNLTT